ncbi:MAG: hypothetical protein V7L11_14335 [Nostoc sp.]
MNFVSAGGKRVRDSEALATQERRVILNFELISSSSPLPYPFHQYFNSELVNSWLWDF